MVQYDSTHSDPNIPIKPVYKQVSSKFFDLNFCKSSRASRFIILPFSINYTKLISSFCLIFKMKINLSHQNWLRKISCTTTTTLPCFHHTFNNRNKKKVYCLTPSGTIIFYHVNYNIFRIFRFRAFFIRSTEISKT